MTKHRTRAAALLAAGALAGGVSAATLTATADDTGTDSGTSSSAEGTTRGGPGGHRGGPDGPGVDAAALAEALDVDEAEVTDALKAAREQTQPDRASEPADKTDGERPARPTEAERAEREAAFAKALADELGVSEAKVTAAIEEVRAARTAERRTTLADRLAEAVTAGTLTDADVASVLKAYDAGLLGGPRRD